MIIATFQPCIGVEDDVDGRMTIDADWCGCLTQVLYSETLDTAGEDLAERHALHLDHTLTAIRIAIDDAVRAVNAFDAALEESRADVEHHAALACADVLARMTRLIRPFFTAKGTPT